MSTNIQSRGHAGRSSGGKLASWSFERRDGGDNDILIYTRGHWGDQPYPQVPGQEIAGVVAAVGKNVSKFKVDEKAGVV